MCFLVLISQTCHYSHIHLWNMATIFIDSVQWSRRGRARRHGISDGAGAARAGAEGSVSCRLDLPTSAHIAHNTHLRFVARLTRCTRSVSTSLPIQRRRQRLPPLILLPHLSPPCSTTMYELVWAPCPTSHSHSHLSLFLTHSHSLSLSSLPPIHCVIVNLPQLRLGTRRYARGQHPRTKRRAWIMAIARHV